MLKVMKQDYWERARELFWKFHNEKNGDGAKDIWIRVYSVLKEEQKIVALHNDEETKLNDRRNTMVRLVICVVGAVVFSWLMTWVAHKIGPDFAGFLVRPLFSVFGFGISALLLLCVGAGVFLWRRVK